MNEQILIQNIRIYPAATVEQTQSLLEELKKTQSKEILLVPSPEGPNLYMGILLAKYHTNNLTDLFCIRGSATEGDFHCFVIHRSNIRSLLQHLSKLMQPSEPREEEGTAGLEPDPLDLFMRDETESAKPAPKPCDPMTQFLMDKTPAMIQHELDELVIGQPELTRAVADFLYYHALRQRHPDLPPRPLLIAGPSGSGKTEVWRAARRLYSSTFSIQIVDGSNLSCDGWAGNYKLSTFITTSFAEGGILVVDEFDKLTRPKFASGGDNVSLQMQSEFLKLIEGEHHITENKRQTRITTRKMGFVLVGAFESLRDQKAALADRAASPIGFHTAQPAIQKPKPQPSPVFTDEDFIAYGIIPEIVGRIATKCSTRSLDDSAYLNIIHSSHSRVAQIGQVLQQYGIQIADVISNEELLEMIKKSRHNRTGVRWVSAQVENRLLEAIREQGLFPGGPRHRTAA